MSTKFSAKSNKNVAVDLRFSFLLLVKVLAHNFVGISLTFCHKYARKTGLFKKY
jgi:hypothetical protein